MSARRTPLTADEIVEGRSANIAPERAHRRLDAEGAEKLRKRELRMILLVVAGIVLACMAITIFR